MVELDPEDLTVSCHVRAPMLMEPVDDHVEALRSCESDGRVDGVVLRSWPDEVTLPPGDPDRDVHERFESFRTWADRAGVDVQPPFETRTRKSLVTGAETDLLVLPLICLALYDDAGGIVGVYPHSADGETYTVEDAIARLRAGEVPVPLSATPTRVVRDDVCPECTGLLVEGDGLYVCPDCAWTGAATDDRDGSPRPVRAGPAVDVSVAPGGGADAGSGGDVDADGVEAEAVPEAGTAGEGDADVEAAAGAGAVAANETGPTSGDDAAPDGAAPDADAGTGPEPDASQPSTSSN